MSNSVANVQTPRRAEARAATRLALAAAIYTQLDQQKCTAINCSFRQGNKAEWPHAAVVILHKPGNVASSYGSTLSVSVMYPSWSGNLYDRKHSTSQADALFICVSGSSNQPTNERGRDLTGPLHNVLFMYHRPAFHRWCTCSTPTARPSTGPQQCNFRWRQSTVIPWG